MLLLFIFQISKRQTQLNDAVEENQDQTQTVNHQNDARHHMRPVVFFALVVSPVEQPRYFELGRRDHGIAFIGNNGTLILNRGGWEVIEERQSKNKVIMPFQKSADNGLDKHWVNFIAAVKSRKAEDLNCSIQAGAHVATVAQMGNISFRSGQKLLWNKAKGSFTDEAINQQYLLNEYHNGYKLPNL